jgi:Flp pilus assembly secretin CpaC
MFGNRFSYLVAASVAAIALSTAQAEAADFSVEINQSRAVHMASPVATLLVGNPAIADVNVEGTKLLYVIGKAYGRTNIIALNSEGKQIAQFNVNVVSQQASSVTLMKGAGQVSYNCTPRCERVVNPSDSSEAFGQTIQQSNQATARAQGGSSSPVPRAEAARAAALPTNVFGQTKRRVEKSMRLFHDLKALTG